MSKWLKNGGTCLSLIFLLLAGGCTSADDAAPTVSDSTAPTPENAGLRILCEDGPPFQIVNADGTLSGLTVEIVEEIQRRIGDNTPIQVVPWARGYEEALNEPNTLLFSMARTAEREDLFHWVGPVTESRFGFYARKDSALKIESLEDAKKVGAVGVYQNDIRDVYLTEAGFTNLDRSHDPVQNFRKLMEGRVDLLAESDNAVQANAELTGHQPDDVKLLYVFMRSQLYVAISRQTDPLIVQQWQAAFAEMQQDGSFAALYHKYFPGKELPGPAMVSDN